MARRDYAAFDAELLVRLANRTDITSTMRGYLLNDAMFKIGIMYEHTQLQKRADITQTINTDTFDVTDSDLWWIEHIRNTTDNRPVTLGDMQKLESVTKRTGPPTQYYTRGANTVYTDTLADAAKTMRVFYVKKPAQWASGNAPYDEQFDILILMWAHKLGLETVRDMEAADTLGKQIGMTVAGMHLPLRKQQMNDWSTGINVRRQ